MYNTVPDPLDDLSALIDRVRSADLHGATVAELQTITTDLKTTRQAERHCPQ